MKIQSFAYRLFLFIVLSGIVCGISAAQNVTNVTRTSSTLVPVDATETTITFYVHSCNYGPAIEGAEIKCVDGGSETHYATTDSKGRAEITGISGSWSFNVIAPNHDVYSRESFNTANRRKGEPYDISLRKSVILALLVMNLPENGGSPIKGAKVTVKDRWGYNIGDSDEYYTDSDGRIEVSGSCLAEWNSV
ncbi:MAG: hypothetical protein PHQ39_12525, partial [Methanothrix soehngenii]|nr:hypothetical protein [Methanothrix soehngenii]